MADETDTEDEPSIEEILDSIRSIISDDDEDEVVEAEAEPEPEVVAEPEPEPESVVEPEPEPESVVEPEPEVEPEEEDDDILELTDKVEDEPEAVEEPEDMEPEPVVAAEPEPEDFDMDDEPQGEPILTQKAQAAAYDGFSELVRKTAVERDGITLEEIVRTELNPLLRNWLDKHLPQIIDRLVREELARLSKRAEADADE